MVPSRWGTFNTPFFCSVAYPPPPLPLPSVPDAYKGTTTSKVPHAPDDAVQCLELEGYPLLCELERSDHHANLPFRRGNKRTNAKAKCEASSSNIWRFAIAAKCRDSSCSYNRAVIGTKELVLFPFPLSYPSPPSLSVTLSLSVCLCVCLSIPRLPPYGTPRSINGSFSPCRRDQKSVA